MTEEKDKDWKIINIDNYKIFNNPFKDVTPAEDSFRLYEKYLNCVANRDILKKVGNNILISSEESNKRVTREEVLQKIACKNKIRTSPAIVYRDVLNNTSGVIVQQVNCNGPMGGKLSEAISLRYSEVVSAYNALKFKTPGAIQMVEVVKDKNYSLWICNLFGEYNSRRAEDWEKITKKKHFLKKGLIKLRVYMRKNNICDIPIYIPYNMGEFQGWSWEDYEPVIMRYIPDAVICRI